MPDRPPTAAEAARDAARAAAQAATALGAALEALSTALPAPLEGPSSAAPKGGSCSAAKNPAARHIAEHRRGVVGKIERDPELEAFVRARIDTMSFPEIEAAIAAAFPPGRRVTDSTLYRWWARSGLRAARRGERGRGGTWTASRIVRGGLP